MKNAEYKQLIEAFKKTDIIFIMAHKDLDLDALGSALGMYRLFIQKHKKPYIIIDDIRKEAGVKKVIDKVKSSTRIIKSREIRKIITKKSALLILDTNKQKLLQNPDVLSYFTNIVVIDHHNPTEETISDGLVIIDKEASSTCEMITELLELAKVKVDPEFATFILSGIVLDTNNFVLKTTERTYRAAYNLAKQGANSQNVQYLLKQDLKKYISRQKVITDVKLIKNIAISKGKHKEIYRKEDLAKIVDTILLFNNIEASFVVGRIAKDTVGISARSMGNIDVGKILELFNGGGDDHEAAGTVKNKTTKAIEMELIQLIKNL